MSKENCRDENISEDEGVEKPKKRGSYITSYQKDRLLLFVENHYDALYERSSAPDIAAADRLWTLLTIQLNSKGPNKNESGWRRCFISYKAATRCKLRGVQSGRTTVDKLSICDLRIAKMCKMDTYGVDMDFLLSRVEGIDSAEVASCSNVLLDQPNKSLKSAVLTLNLPLINENDYMEAMSSSSFIVDIDESLLGNSGNVSNIAKSNQNVKLSSSANQAADTNRILNIGDIVTGFIPEDIDGKVFENHMETVSQNSDENILTHSQKTDRSHATEAQKDKLVQLIGENYSALFGRISNKINADVLKAKLWNQITLNLNSMGPKKSVQSWKRCLSSLKDITKKKITVARNHPRSNVHGKIATTKIISRETELIKLFGNDILDGCGQLDELGYSSTSEREKRTSTECEDVEETDYMAQPVSSCTNSTVTSAMASDTHGTHIENTHDQPSASQPVHSNNVTKSTVSFALATASNSQNTREPLQSRHQSRSNQTHQSLYHHNNTVVTLDQLKTIAENQKLKNARQVPSTSNCVILNDTTAGQVRAESIPFTSKNVSDNRKRKIVGSNGSNRLSSTKKKSDDLSIRPLDEPRPQRRGVEVHPKRYVRARPNTSNSQAISDENGDSTSDDNEEVSNRRRFRLSKPLGVLAEESLLLQRKNNSLLREMLEEMRKPK